MAVLNTGLAKTSASDYEISNSLRFNDDDSAYLSRTPSSAGNRKTWTWSGWVKRGNLGTEGMIWSAGTGLYKDYVKLTTANKLFFVFDNGSTYVGGTISPVIRDPSAWFHLLIKMDTANQVFEVYINGEAVNWDSKNSITLNYTPQTNNTVEHRIGQYGGGGQYFDGYLAEVNFVDGQALTPADFGETGDYGEWKPIEYTGTYGTNGFYLDFSNSGSLGTDASSNSNNWTPNNLSATDQMLDSPTNNFATWNAVEPTPTGLFAEGNTHYYANAVTTKGAVAGTIGFSGKFYWEVLSSSTNQYHTEKIGIAVDGFALNQNIGYESSTWGYGSNGGSQYKYHNNSATYLGGRQIGDIQMVAVDTDAGKVWFGRNGTWHESGNPATGANAQFTDVPSVVRPAASVYSNNNGIDGSICNFGQDSSFAGNKTAQGNQDSNGIGDFYYTPPTDFLALCTQNLPEPTVIPSEHFNTILFTGDGTDDRSITGVGFAPDLSWLKSRPANSGHNISDKVRGDNKILASHTTAAEATLDTIVSLDSDGFTVGDGNGYDVNKNGESIVAWNWKANGSGVSNTDGTITSTVSANVDAGFSIVSYTGVGSVSTVGHGLSSAPEMIILKERTLVDNWFVYHSGNTSAPETENLRLNLTNATADSLTYWNDTAPSSSVFTLGTTTGVNDNGEDYIVYAFHSVDGYSKVGSYISNQNADGPFVYTGFRPAFIMVKRTNSTGHWEIHDTKRDAINQSQMARLFPNYTNAESDSDGWDILSNGFKLRTTHSSTNEGSLIYIAFAETPFSKSNAR